MTYCLGIKTTTGLVGIADRRITSGSETTLAKKLFVHNRENHSLFIMTSGLRSVRDKALTYFKEAIEEEDPNFNKLYLSNYVQNLPDEWMDPVFAKLST